MLLSLFEESCKLHVHLAQSLARGLWRVGGLVEARFGSAAAAGQLVLVFYTSNLPRGVPEVDECGLAEIGNSKEETCGHNLDRFGPQCP
jgi:hypothetical protein